MIKWCIELKNSYIYILSNLLAMIDIKHLIYNILGYTIVSSGGIQLLLKSKQLYKNNNIG